MKYADDKDEKPVKSSKKKSRPVPSKKRKEMMAKFFGKTS